MNEPMFNPACFTLDVPDDASYLVRCWNHPSSRYQVVVVDDLKEFCRSLVRLYEELQESEEIDVSTLFDDEFTVVGYFSHMTGFLTSYEIGKVVGIGNLSGILENPKYFWIEK